AADLRGPQWCRIITPAERDAVVAASGPDPLRGDTDPGVGYERLRRSGKSIAALLMDQRIAAGIGNIFRAEVLFRHRLDPTIPGRELSRKSWDILWEDLVGLMETAVDRGRIDTVVDDHSPEVQGRPPRVDAHGGEVYVYRRTGQPCLVCGTEIRTTMLEGRTMYWCPRCQRRKTAAP
ncbi:MAG: Fpg/Nei family DNA glycosylase, partial [Propionibacteriaceae bacterium]|nr:Fpg/Nei family DNA glycosylase [Propionibacteriaceae bacterium]